LAGAAAFAGHSDECFIHSDAAERLARHDVLAHGYAGASDHARAAACFAIEHYLEGIDFARKAITCSPNLPPAHRLLLANLALAGRSDEASGALQSVRRLTPNLSTLWIKQRTFWMADKRKRFVEAFRIAGLN
jgi:hypothetical protein